MRSFLAALMKEGVISIVVLILLCLLVWFGGEYLKTEDNDLFKERILIIAILIGIFLLLFVIQKVLAVRSAVRIEQQLKAQSGSQLEGADADKKAEIESLSKTFNESLEALKKTKGGKSALFTLPWYIIIGPPGSGKTTALQESGLNFPAAQGGAKVRGIGGTRNCDWWFTEDGILLDTAGRYTTVAEDQEEWFAFLEMIRTSRKDKPINGAIVAIAIDELFRATQSELDQIAKDVRNRLDELAARLQGVFPVYMMFTKCDLIQGFVEYFEDLNKEQRSQVWGFTFPYSLPDKQYTEIFTEQVAAMGKNIQARQLELLSTERPPQKKQNIYLFPRQFDLASEKMKEFLGSLFSANAFQESAMLRGIYFTSGTQKGTPIDQILSRMGEAMGLGASPEGSEDRVEKKSYFIHNLFTKVIFHDKTLARSSSKVLRRRRAVRLSLQIASLVALAVCSWVLVTSFYGNYELISDVEAAGGSVKEMHSHQDPHLEDLQELEALRKELAELDRFKQEGRPIRLSFGMYQGDDLLDAGNKLYFARLRPVFIEPSGKRIEAELGELVSSLKSNSPSSEYVRLLEVWRVYRMLSGKLPAKPDMVSVILKKDGRWAPKSGDTTNAEQIENLAGEQLEYYASQLSRMKPDSDPLGLLIPLNPQLDKRASDKLQNAFWTVSAYDAIIQHASEKLKKLTLQDLVPENNQYLELSTEGTSGTNLTRLNAFTQEAWDTEVKDLIDNRAKELAELYTELGITKSADEIRADLYKRHRNSHISVWNLVLDKARPKPSMFLDDFNQEHVKRTNESLKLLVGDTSPLRTLIQAAWKRRQLTLEPGDEIPGPDDAELKGLESAMGELSKFADAYNAFWNASAKGKRVITGSDSTEVLDALAGQFRTTTQELPKPFPSRDADAARFLMRVVDISFKALLTEGDAEIKKNWSSKVYEYWNDNFKGKYPFKAGTSQSVSMANFSSMFNPKTGRIWTLDNRLSALEKMSFGDQDQGSTKTPRRLVILSNEYEKTIELAAKIRDAMFAQKGDIDKNGELMNVEFTLKVEPVGLLNGYTVEIGSKRLSWNDNPDNSLLFGWRQTGTVTDKIGARITASVRVSRERMPAKDLLDDQWGVLRMVNSPYTLGLEEEKSGDNPVYKCTWIFKTADGQPYELKGTITPQQKLNPFQKGLFTDFMMTEKVSR
ncbi:MAG: type VI secretion system membrane subunit TssM [Planctomycetota bacterium]